MRKVNRGMYRIIAVDDEVLSLKRFEHLIQKEPRVNLLKSFSNPEEVIDFIKENTVDIAFLDIEMPGINGLELAEMIQETDSHVNCIFVTAFDQYALEAFKAHAFGYLLKPLDIKELSTQLDIMARNVKPRPDKKINKSDEPSNRKLVVKCIGQFTCHAEDIPDSIIAFRTAKTAELFALLVARYNSSLSKFSIIDSMFPDMDYEKSTKLFYVSCSYLRSAFAKYNINDVLIRENDNYRINTAVIDCDYINLCEAEKDLADASIEKLEKLAAYCNGEFLMGKPYEWAYELRAYMETLSSRVLNNLADAYINEDLFPEAMQILEKYLIADPCNEDNVEKLMTLYIDSGQMPKARALYNSFSSKLYDQFGLKPSERITSLLN